MFEECALYSFSTGDRFHEKAMTPQGVGVCFSYFQAHPSILFIAVAVVPANLCEVAPKACYNSSFCFGGLMSGVFCLLGSRWSFLVCVSRILNCAKAMIDLFNFEMRIYCACPRLASNPLAPCFSFPSLGIVGR